MVNTAYSLSLEDADMSKNTSEIPITELVERSQQLARTGNNTFSKIRGIVQDVTIREIPSKFDWNFLLVSSSLTTIEQYNTGTASVNTGATAVTFSSDVTTDASFVGRKIKFQSGAELYTITSFGGAQSLTIDPAFRNSNNITNGSYVIFQNIYPISNDFDRFPKKGGVYRYEGNQRRPLEEKPYRQYMEDVTYSPVTQPEHIRLVGQDTAGNQLIELIPPPSTARNMGYDYFKQLRPMAETSAGTLSSISAGATSVNGNTDTRFLDIYRNHSGNNVWFRVTNLGVASDSEWYRVLNIQNDSALTLATAFANTAITSSANYVIAESPDMPPRLHIGVLYGTVRTLNVDQNDEHYALYHTQYYQVLSDSKRIYVSRPYDLDIEGIHEEYRYRV